MATLGSFVASTSSCQFSAGILSRSRVATKARFRSVDFNRGSTSVASSGSARLAALLRRRIFAREHCRPQVTRVVFLGSVIPDAGPSSKQLSSEPARLEPCSTPRVVFHLEQDRITASGQWLVFCSAVGCHCSRPPRRPTGPIALRVPALPRLPTGEPRRIRSVVVGWQQKYLCRAGEFDLGLHLCS